MKKSILFSVLVVGATLLQAQSITVHQTCGQNGQVLVIGTNGHACVDLGLPSGTLWATCNVGATTPEGYGEYFAWGETVTKATYYLDNYFDTNDGGNTFTKYKNKGGKTVLDPEDDAAHVNWGGSWRMPTMAEWQELLDNCTWTWTTQNGINGYKVTSNKAGYTDKFIFLPAAGFRSGYDLLYVGSSGCYRSSSLCENSSDRAWNLGFYSDCHYLFNEYRDNGLSVRPVLQASSISSSSSANDTIRIYSNGCDNYQTFIGSHGSQLTMTANSAQWSHFVRWNDGNTDNPRTITTNGNADYTAYFETYRYSVQVQSNDAARGRGYISKVVKEETIEYNESVGTFDAGSEVYLASQANYGYHFDKWSDGNRSQQRSFILSKDTTFTATFAKNVYSITKNAEHGSISGNSSAEYLDFVTLTATPDYGYHFTQWSDGNTENPRTIILTQDTTFIAEFSISSCLLGLGTCGSNISWELSCDSILILTGAGEMENLSSSSSPWYILRNAIKSVIIAEGITSIGDKAFDNCSGLTSITIPNSVTSIGDYAFRYCSGLTSVTIGNSVISIGDYAFQNCSGMTGELVIPNSVTSIGSSAFRGCTGLTSVTIGNSVTSIGNSAFAYCSSLTSVIWNAKNCAVFGYNTAPFNNIRSQITSFTFSNEVEHIPAYLCNDMSNLTSIEIPNSVTSIGDYVFYGCSGLTSVTIGNSVTSIGERAFSGCYALEDVTIGTGVIELGRSVFTNSANIKRVQWNAINYRQTKPNADSNCFPFYASRNSITSFIFGDDVEYIPEYLFKDFSAIHSLVIPASVTEIAQYAFANNSLAEIICLAETPPTLGNDAFYGSNAQIYVPCGTLDAYKTAWSEYASQIKYEPLKYHITGNVNIEGSGSVQLPQNKCEDVITASPNYGYHFVRWNDGNTDNPRTIVLASDTTFTVEFAKNTYSISTTSANPEWGTTAGGKSALYLDEVEISATANYGYHFVKWNDNNTSNPRTVSVTEDKTYTATFAKNVYSITKNAEHGTISGNSSAEYLDYVTLTVNPDYGYHFTQWSDGLKDNPRIAQITQDTTFTAEFAYDRVGTCGKDFALTWSYDPTNKVLTIGNAGEFTENMQFGVEAPNEMEELVIGNSVTAIGENAFAGIETLKKVTIGETVKTIHNNAFYNCVNLETIFNYRPTPTNAYSTAFDGVDKFECKLYVLPSSIDMYKNASVWRDFYYTYAIGAVETTVTTNDVTVEPQDNAATVTWPTSNNAATYTIEITKDGVVFCTLIFNGNGQLTGIAFAPGKNGNHHAPAAKMTPNGMQFTVTGLNNATHYALTLQAKDDQDAVLASYSSEFTTTGTATAINQITNDKWEMTNKIIRDGNVLILRGDKTYTLTGTEVK